MKFYSCLLAALVSAPHVQGAAPLRVLYRVETVAGSNRIGDGGPAIAAQLSNILGVAADRFGNVYISETDNHRIRKISREGVITTLAGTGIAGFSGDGGPAAAAQLNLPYGLAADMAGFVYVADLSPSIPDEEVLQQANVRRAVLITADKDFGELVFRQGLVHSGVACFAWRDCRT